ncbi:MAG TPA: TonB family protein [Steroidobacteraceae bacterium]|nr:TonB family protein [Steroidobacteraceae bacterium]
MSEVWTRWQGHLINGVFPLGRYLGCSDHSGVFLTRSAAQSGPDIAIKLVPADRALAEFQLPRWKRAGGLAHPHLLRLLEWGGCQLDGSPYLYVAMEHADQTLAQLLPHRALTDDEVREMLVPLLDALAFLHERNFVHGHLKPANILVVGDQLKLASDTIGRIGERGPNAHAPAVYDPPEALPGTGSPAGDVWALGASLFEALTRRPPARVGERGDALALPADFSPAFREIVTRCLSPRSPDRPTVPELMAWARGRSIGSVPAETVQPVAVAHAERARPPTTAISSEPPRVPIAVALGIVLILAIGWAGWHLFESHRTGSAPLLAARSSAALPSAPSGATAPRPATIQPLTSGASGAAAATPRASDASASLRPLHEAIPDVPLSARRTIRGHIKVWVRVVVDADGSVTDATADRPGPSRYFQRLALEAARKWTFPAVSTSSQRLMQIRFEFARDGTRGRAVPLGRSGSGA